ncbi:MAG: GlsB/YeaQ/YmgE family stress response membrane protein [Lactococcus sp.]|nr:GlsB/YeaQ/YmgE family stress response membrane protein [Lactococcus sp.]
MIWSLIVGAIIGVIAGAITSKGKSMGWIANILAGLVGSAVGQALLGSWGPSLAGMALIPSIIGAVIVVAVVSFFLGKTKDEYNSYKKITLWVVFLCL